MDILPAVETVTIDVETARGWVRLELTRAQSEELRRVLADGWLPGYFR